jgi:hypothetical protein
MYRLEPPTPQPNISKDNTFIFQHNIFHIVAIGGHHTKDSIDQYYSHYSNNPTAPQALRRN